ncbi:aldehyde dehydrogenase family protein [Halococcus thailandensis]|uniref:Aldehyde Dehydrogenase n=1 Tax=Halococcus thailandensis JCM 13552 TaxID=1227457 RepID=M0NGU2_9EURY|nr:aldehyde dehydrogenase family protein [Halococcus thailandensis]EMA56329.1 Aldehyde Dehydrogenase [Halococcus thailandensis JCM 13552]
MPETYRNYINGEWIESENGDTITVRNPADTSDVIGEVQQSTRDDAQQAIAAAVAVTDEWADMPGPSRGEILRKGARLRIPYYPSPNIA